MSAAQFDRRNETGGALQYSTGVYKDRNLAPDGTFWATTFMSRKVNCERQKAPVQKSEIRDKDAVSTSGVTILEAFRSQRNQTFEITLQIRRHHNGHPANPLLPQLSAHQMVKKSYPGLRNRRM